MYVPKTDNLNGVPFIKTIETTSKKKVLQRNIKIFNIVLTEVYKSMTEKRV